MNCQSVCSWSSRHQNHAIVEWSCEIRSIVQAAILSDVIASGTDYTPSSGWITDFASGLPIAMVGSEMECCVGFTHCTMTYWCQVDYHSEIAESGNGVRCFHVSEMYSCVNDCVCVKLWFVWSSCWDNGDVTNNEMNHCQIDVKMHGVGLTREETQ